MSQYYKSDRSSDWNYGGNKWRLSRSKIELFVECPRCFYIDNKLGTGRPRGPSFTLNVAVDALLKKEFDVHRVRASKHPLMEHYGIMAVPFQHPKMDIWRENFKGIEHRHKETGMVISGAVDDVWQDADGKLIVVDYKATSKNGKIVTLDDSAWAAQYARQMGIYQWLLRQEGFQVASRGYFVYANASADKEAFDAKLEFEVTLVPCDGETEWIEPALIQLKKTLDADELPSASPDCDFCTYREAVGKKLQRFAKKTAHAQGTLGL
jgi:hypothetical protein